MLILKLNAPGRSTGTHQLTAIAEVLDRACNEWEQERKDILNETHVVNRHKVAEDRERNIEFAEYITTALRKAVEKYDAGEWASSESVVEIEV
jgi:hypothetical protein